MKKRSKKAVWYEVQEKPKKYAAWEVCCEYAPTEESAIEVIKERKLRGYKYRIVRCEVANEREK